MAVLALAAGCQGGQKSGEDPRSTPPVKTPLPVQGLERIKAVSDRSSGASQEMVARCPAGKKVLGGGGQVIGGGREVRMSGLRPQPDGSGYWVRADEDGDGYAKAWSLEAYAMCAREPAGLEYLTAKSQDSVHPNEELPLGMLIGDRRRGAIVTCPAGKNLTGGGVEVLEASGNAVVSFTGGTNGETEGEDEPAELTARAFLKGGGTANPQIVGHAVCVDPLEKYHRMSNRDLSFEVEKKESKVSCVEGMRMLGLSVYVVQTGEPVAGENIFDALTLIGAVPNEKLEKAVLAAVPHAEFKEHNDSTWLIGGSVYCAKTVP
ncbi:hypothetical protein [Actinocorallia libanotica]|uniref:hypothetical protein n=1 Tax=Actinocorallia libanotica TaxID=46162 RepID=UPI0031D9C664